MKSAVALMCLLGLLYLPCTAQIGGGSIVGFVQDPSAAAVVGARVSAENMATSEVRTTSTNVEGYYEFPLLPAGEYRLTAEATGFQKAVSGNLNLHSGTRPRIDLKLVIGALTDTVMVVSKAPLLNVTSTDLGVVINSKEVSTLPLNGRNWEQLVNLQAGVVDAPASDAGGNGGIEFNGAASFSNNLMLDGIDMTFVENGAAANYAAAGSNGVIINTVSVEGVEEFKSSGSSLSAEYGRATGGVINITTKSGTNQFHGTLFEFFRNDKMDAKSFFTNFNGLAKPPLRWNQFGGNLGGPVRRNKIFFFANYEGAQIHRDVGITANVPTPALLAQLTPALRQEFSAIPTTFAPTSNPLIGLHTRNDSQKNEEHTLLARGDVELGAHRLTMRTNYNHQNYSIPNLAPGMPQIYPMRFHHAVVQDNYTISPTMFNELRIGFNRSDLKRGYAGTPPEPATAGVASAGLSGPPSGGINFQDSSYTIADNLSKIHGRHSFKTGFELRLVRAGRYQYNLSQEHYNSVADLIADKFNDVTVVFSGEKGLSNRDYGFYAQDEWRVNPRMQINIGLRYEYFPPVKGAFNIATANPWGPFAPAGTPLTKPDRNNWGPRLGLVADLTGRQKLILRAGGAITYMPPMMMYYYSFAFLTPFVPFNPSFLQSNLPPGYPLAYPFDSTALKSSLLVNPNVLPPGTTVPRTVENPNDRDEYAAQWNLSLQYALTSSLSVQGSYTGNRGLKLTGMRTLNLKNPKTGQVPDPTIGTINIFENAGRVSYHALQLSANQRLARGVTANVYYTFSKALVYYAADTNTVSNRVVQDDENNIAGSYGPKIGDVKHRVVGVASYEIPTARFASPSRLGRAVFRGWTGQGIMTWRSGIPINVTSGIDQVGNTFLTPQRPDLVYGVSPYFGNPNSLRWLNPAAFNSAIPASQKRFGNLGYNALLGPTAFNIDASLHKTFAITEKNRIMFRAEFFNLDNHTTFANPNSVLTNASFGRLLGTATSSRNIQLALKYQF
jgi:hypothetical protein